MKFIGKSTLWALVAGIIVLFGSSCAKKPSLDALAAEAPKLNAALESAAAANPQMLTRAEAAIDERGDLAVTISFADTKPSFQFEYGQSIVDFLLAKLLKTSDQANVANLINALSKSEAHMSLNLIDPMGSTHTFDYAPERLRHLLKTPASQLNFSEVKAVLLGAFASRAQALANEAKAESARFELANSFATYTLVFERESDYSRLKQANLTARYHKVFDADLEYFGTFLPFMKDVFKELGVDGIRVVYKAAGDRGKELRSALPWRILGVKSDNNTEVKPNN